MDLETSEREVVSILKALIIKNEVEDYCYFYRNQKARKSEDKWQYYNREYYEEIMDDVRNGWLGIILARYGIRDAESALNEFAKTGKKLNTANCDGVETYREAQDRLRCGAFSWFGHDRFLAEAE